MNESQRVSQRFILSTSGTSSGEEQAARDADRLVEIARAATPPNSSDEEEQPHTDTSRH